MQVPLRGTYHLPLQDDGQDKTKESSKAYLVLGAANPRFKDPRWPNSTEDPVDYLPATGIRMFHVPCSMPIPLTYPFSSRNVLRHASIVSVLDIHSHMHSPCPLYGRNFAHVIPSIRGLERHLPLRRGNLDIESTVRCVRNIMSRQSTSLDCFRQIRCI